jgi:hypothetical protein
MRTPITYKYISNGTQEFAQMQSFAKSFDHEIISHPNISVCAHYRGDVCFGYSDHVFIPTVYPAFHPELTRPRDVIQVLSDWRVHNQISSKPSFIGVPMPDAPGRANFPEETMNKLGLTRMQREIYSL